MIFKDWIKQYIDEDSPRGDLARDIEMDLEFPDTDKHGEAFYRLHMVGADMKAISTFSEVWREYKAEHGENNLYFELMDTDTNIIFSKFIKEKEIYQFMLKLQEQGIKFDLISELENVGDEEDNPLIIEIDESFKSFCYSNLDEVINELNRFKNVVPFPMGKLK